MLWTAGHRSRGLLLLSRNEDCFISLTGMHGTVMLLKVLALALEPGLLFVYILLAFPVPVRLN